MTTLPEPPKIVLAIAYEGDEPRWWFHAGYNIWHPFDDGFQGMPPHINGLRSMPYSDEFFCVIDHPENDPAAVEIVRGAREGGE